MALLNLGDDPWLSELEACEKLQRDIMEQLTIRSQQNKSLENFSRISATIRIRLKQYNNEVAQLKQKLVDAYNTRMLTFEEKERRTRQIEYLQTKALQMQKIFDDQTQVGNTRERSQLLSSDWGSSRDDQLLTGNDGDLTVTDIKSQTSRMLEEQERGLENLSEIIARQKNIAQNISSEVDIQNDIIDDLGDHIDRTDVRIRGETQHIGVVDRKDKTCIYWVIIILLFIAIIAVVCV